MGNDSPITFIKQSIKDFRNTGSLAPSSQFLARAMARSLPEHIPDDYRVLEVGPGTGSITSEIVKRMNGRGHLDLFEISPTFCKVLRRRLADEPEFRRMRSRVVVHQGDVRSLPPHPRFNAIISGLPFSNFRPEEVQGFLEHFRALLKPKGALIWFEYVALRRIQSVFVSKTRREQLRGVAAVTRRFVRSHPHRQEIIAINFPPARVLHLRFG
ncbi:MAG: methyltransferase domain-containing protein [Planctomycetota bacterium]|nr:methyltransferase domain-containing protein [Planctomycetota bacterium]